MDERSLARVEGTMERISNPISAVSEMIFSVWPADRLPTVRTEMSVGDISLLITV